MSQSPSNPSCISTEVLLRKPLNFSEILVYNVRISHTADFLKRKENDIGFAHDKITRKLPRELRKFYYKNYEWCKTSIYSKINLKKT